MIEANTEASSFIRSKPALTKAAFNRLLPEIKAHAFTIAGVECLRIQQSIRDEIASIPDGALWEDVKASVVAQLDPYFVDPAADAETREKQARAANRRAELLIRTHTSMAYAQTAYAVADEQRDLFPFWQYQTLGDGAVRPSHAALDGVVLPHDHPFWKTHTPPWDWGCRCQFIPLSDADVEELRAQDKALPEEKKRVLDAAALEKLEKENVIWRTANLANGTGHPVPYNVQSPAEAGKPGAFTWQPGAMKPDVPQLRASHPEAFDDFEKWAKTQPLPELKLTVWEWLSGSPIIPPTAPVTLPTPKPATYADTLKAAGLDVKKVWTEAGITKLLATLKQPGAVRAADKISRFIGTNKTGEFSEATLTRYAQEFLDIIPPDIARKLPPFVLETKGTSDANGDYDPGQMHLRLFREALNKQLPFNPNQVKETLWHEMTHWLHMHGPEDYRERLKKHFEARTAGEKPQPSIYGGLTLKDKWWEEYAGKLYGGGGWPGTNVKPHDGVELPTRYMQLLANPKKLIQQTDGSLNPNLTEFHQTMEVITSILR